MRIFLPFQSAPCCGTSNSEYSVIPKEFGDSERGKEGQEKPKFRISVQNFILSFLLSVEPTTKISVMSPVLCQPKHHLPASTQTLASWRMFRICLWDCKGKTSTKHTFATRFWLGQAGGHSCTPDFHHNPFHWKEDAGSIIGSSKERVKTGSRKVQISPAKIILPFIQASCISEAQERNRRNQGRF